MVLSVQKPLFITLNRRHFLVGCSFDTGFDSTCADTKEEIIGPSTRFFIRHRFSVFAASCGNGIERLTVRGRYVCIKCNTYVLLVHFCQRRCKAYRLVKRRFCRRITESEFAVFVNPRHTFFTRFFITLVVVKCKIIFVVSVVLFFGLCNRYGNSYLRFKFVTRRVFNAVNELVFARRDTHVFHFGEILPACKQRACRFTCFLFVKLCRNKRGNIHVARLVDCRRAGQFNICACNTGNTAFNAKTVHRRFIDNKRTRFVVSNRQQSKRGFTLISCRILAGINDFISEQGVGRSFKRLFNVPRLFIDDVSVYRFSVCFELRNRHLYLGRNVAVHVIRCRCRRQGNRIAYVTARRHARNTDYRSFRINAVTATV